MEFNRMARGLAFAAALMGAALSGAQAQTVKIGVIAPLTGPGAPWGIAMAQAARIAAADANARGGVNLSGTRYKVEVIAYDDQYKAAEAVAAYNRLVRQDGVKYLMTLSSASMMAVKDAVESEKIVTVTGAYAAKAIDEKTKYVFRTFSTSHNYMKPLVDWMKVNLKERRIAIINANDETGWDQAQLAEKSYKEGGFTVAASPTRMCVQACVWLATLRWQASSQAAGSR